MREKIILYGKEDEEDLEKFFGRGYRKRMFIFESLSVHNGHFESCSDISSSPCGYVAYGRYIIPILLAFSNDNKLKSHHEDNFDYFIKYIDTISGISFECLDRSCYGNIIIGEALFYCLKHEKLIPIIYHEIGHLVALGFMEETDADRFAAAHVGPQNLLAALKTFEAFRFSFKRNVAEIIMSTIDIDDRIDQLMAVALSEDSSLSLYREEFIERCKYKKGLPIMRLYLSEDIVNKNKIKEEK